MIKIRIQGNIAVAMKCINDGRIHVTPYPAKSFDLDMDLLNYDL